MGLSKRPIITGVAVHNDLTGRSVADGHPQSAITGLEAAITDITETANEANSLATSASSTASSAASTASSANATAGAVDTKVGTLASLLTTAKTNIVAAVNELFTLAANGKTTLAAAINGKGGTANDSMTFSQLGDAVTAIPNVTEATGDAVASNVLAGKTFSNAVGNGITGTMPNKVGSATVITPNTTEQTIPQGYYGGASGDGKVLPYKFIAGLTYNIASFPDQISPAYDSYTKVREVNIPLSGSVNVSFGIAVSSTSGGFTGYAKIYVDGVAVGTERVSTSNTFNYFSENINIPNPDSKVQLYVHRANGSFIVLIKDVVISVTNKLIPTLTL